MIQYTLFFTFFSATICLIYLKLGMVVQVLDPAHHLGKFLSTSRLLFPDSSHPLETCYGNSSRGFTSRLPNSGQMVIYLLCPDLDLIRLWMLHLATNYFMILNSFHSLSNVKILAWSKLTA